MNDKQQHGQPSGGITLGDVYFILFRHKWKILILSFAGLAAGVMFYLLWPVPYESEAKLFIRYVQDNQNPALPADNSKVLSPDPRGGDIINSEIELLTSLDLAEQVVDTVGASNILAKAGGGDSRLKAAVLIGKNLSVSATKDSSVMDITFQSRDPAIVQPVLQELIADYKSRHVEIHNGVGLYDDFFSQKTAQLKSQIDQIDQNLQTVESNTGIFFPADATKAYSDQISKLNQELLDTQTELAEDKAVLASLKASQTATVITNSSPMATNANPAAFTSQDQQAEYTSLLAQLDVLRKKQLDYLSQGFSNGNLLVKEIRKQINDVQNKKDALEKANPQLVTSASKMVSGGSSSGGQLGDIKVTDAGDEITQIAALESKLKVLDSQLKEVKAEAIAANQAANQIASLQQQKQTAQANYQYYLSGLDHLQADETLGSAKISGISTIQSPSPPFENVTKILKITALIIFAGLGGGLALAFLIELFLDRSIKRPIEVETKLGLRLYVSIPYLSASQRRRLAASYTEPLQLQSSAGGTNQETIRPEIAPWSGAHVLRPFYEALRDRLITHFEAKNLTRKPKLVAVTSPSKGAGVSTIAAGLAASLSETGEGNVLLVSMNSEQEIAQEFSKGKLDCRLDDVLENGNRVNAQVQDNLYVVAEGANNNGSGNGKIPRFMPKRFLSFLPKLKASDYDYIIFDMPPITQTSITARLAVFMDMNLVVVESEKTDRDVVKQASTLLAETKADVSIVLNKTRKYVPARLHQEFLSD
jgi:uncharacterized protein involved in exopolysaccharide biosynthesis/Mrp family chromosome partitioning ATPase